MVGLELGGMDKRRVEGIEDDKRRMGRRLPVFFLGCACTGKRREQHPLDIRQPDSAAFVHATRHNRYVTRLAPGALTIPNADTITYPQSKLYLFDY